LGRERINIATRRGLEPAAKALVFPVLHGCVLSPLPAMDIVGHHPGKGALMRGDGVEFGRPERPDASKASTLEPNFRPNRAFVGQQPGLAFHPAGMGGEGAGGADGAVTGHDLAPGRSPEP